MIAFLSGEIIETSLSSLVLNVNGVGYEINIAEGESSSFIIGDVQDFLIHTEVREDSISLYGFKTIEAKKCFLLLKTVKGVAAKSAAEILSGISINELISAIGSSDFVRIQKIKGIGKKTAERIVLELKEKILTVASNSSEIIKNSNNTNLSGKIESSIEDDALSALIALGFAKKDSIEMLRRLEKDLEGAPITSLTAGQIVSDALRYA